MARFNLEDYETVDARLERFWHEHPTGAVITELVTDASDLEQVVFKAAVFFDASGERSVYNAIPNGIGHAYGKHKTGGGFDVDATSWIENAETSAVGRALADAGYKSKADAPRPSREEMAGASSRDTGSVADPVQRYGNISTDGEVFEGPHTRYMKTVDLNTYAHDKGFKSSGVQPIRSEVEHTYGVKIAGTGKDGGVMPVDVANAIAHFDTSPEVSTDDPPF